MDTKIFVNLPVKDLNKSMGFFTNLGFEFNPQFTDQNAACMIIANDIYVMLVTETFFKTFTNKEISNTANTTESILSLYFPSKEKVNEFVNKAIEGGGKTYKDPNEQDGMYGWGFEDLDGHLWEAFYMDPSIASQS